MNLDSIMNKNMKEVQQLCISLVPIFNHLKYEDMKEIVKTTKMTVYERNDMIYRAGDRSNRLYIVHKGQVKIYRLAESGREQLLRIMEPGDFMGELALFSESTFDHYAEATTKTEICMMHRHDLQSFLLKFPTISLEIMTEFSKRLGQAEQLVSRLTSQDVEKRTASYLAELAETQGRTNITLPMSKKDLASYLGTTPETISRKLAELQDLGWIAQTGQRKIRILNRQALKEV